MSELMNASLEALLWMELASAEVAIPASPIAAERASGTILRKGTAEMIVFGQSIACVKVHWLVPRLANRRKSTRSEVNFMKVSV